MSATPNPASNQNKEREGFIETLGKLRPYLWPDNRRDLQLRIYLAFVIMIASKLATMLTPFAFKWATDSLVVVARAPDAAAALVSPDASWLWKAPVLLTIVYGLSRILMAMLTQMRDAVFAKVAMHAVRSLALETFEHIHQLSLRFHLERRMGGLTRILERGRRGIEDLSRLVVSTLIPTIVEFVLVLGILAWEFNWLYSLTVLLMVIVYLGYTYRATNWRMDIRRRMNESDVDANTKAVDSLINYETVKYFSAEQREAARYDTAMVRYEQASVETYTSLALLNAGQAFIFSVGMTIIMILSVLDIMAGRASIGSFVLVNAMMVQLYMPLNFMGMLYRDIKQALTDIEDMFQLIGRNPEIQDVPDAKPLDIKQAVVRFENIHFAYTLDRPILRGVSFDIPAGKTVAIVGPSGAGKSTLSRLLFRFYEPQQGSILIDGQNIASVQQGSLRRAIGMVPQDTVLFNDTIGYNIQYGRWDASDEDVAEAARLAQIDTFIASLPEGYKTQVGERGLKLSGGEKQRVAIARTILKSPPILVLDEATSALDSFTEREIQDALDRVSRGRTTLVIAHRLSTVVGADEIIVLDKGLIAERGSHYDLLDKKGIYAAMWNRQREADAARETLKRAEEEEGASFRQTLEG